MVSWARHKQDMPAPSAKPTPETVMRNVDTMIGLVEDNYRAFQKLPANERRPGAAEVMHITVYGRATTNVLQKLRSVNRAEFDAWYAPVRAWMKDDPLMKYFYELRSRILKEGETGDFAFVIHEATLNLDNLDANVAVKWNYRFGETPTEHKGQVLEDLSVEHLVWLYVEALRGIVKAAHTKFG
jgi:hypothetical protein